MSIRHTVTTWLRSLSGQAKRDTLGDRWLSYLHVHGPLTPSTNRVESNWMISDFVKTTFRTLDRRRANVLPAGKFAPKPRRGR